MRVVGKSALLVSALMLSMVLASQSYAQSTSRASSVLDRYGNLGVERTGVTIDPALAQKHYRRGNTYSNLERFEEAIDEYKLSIAADPTMADSIRNLANVYYYLERYEEAIPQLHRFIRLQTGKSAALLASLNTLGELYRDSGRYDEAIEIDLRALEEDPKNESQVHLLGNTYNNIGRAGDAIRIYEKAIEVNPGTAFNHRILGKFYAEDSRLQDALLQYESAARLDDSSQFYKDLVASTRAKLAR